MDLLSGPAQIAVAAEPETASEGELTLLPHLEPWGWNFLRNLRDTFLLRGAPAVDITAPPGEFWPDVFVRRALPWRGFFESGFGHVVVIAGIWGLSSIWPTRPQLTPVHTFDRSQVIYFSPSEYLPPLETGDVKPSESRQPDPEYAKQPILSVPPEADNHRQTIVSPPEVRLSQDIATPNIVAWGDHSVPVPLAATERDAPAVNSLTVPVVAPPPDPRFNDTHRVALLAPTVVAPAPEVRTDDHRALPALRESVVPPPPAVQMASQRVGELTVAPSQIIAPAPQLSLPEQRSVPALSGSRRSVVPPPPSIDAVSRAGNTGGGPVQHRASANAAGNVIPPPPSTAGESDAGTQRLIALSVHPEAVPPPVAPGNRRGTFAASPEGKPGATATPGSSAHGIEGTDGRNASAERAGSPPPGLHVGAAPQPNPGSGAGPSHAGSDLVNPNLFARAYAGAPSLPPRTRVEASPDPPKTALERKVFGDRHVYSMTLNMPNLNSAGGSWVIRFADSKPDAPEDDLTAPVAIHKVDPAYPLELMRRNVAGTVTLQAVIAVDGSVENVQVLQGVDERLDRFACEALRRWRFFPATRNGNPVQLDAVVMIPFRPIPQKRIF
jgi:TonB family protein